MNARDRGVSTETRTGLDAEGPLRRWARRRREVAREEEAAAEARRRKAPRESSRKAPHEAPDVRDSDAGASGPAASAAAEAEKVLTDEDMPSLDSLGEDSDYSGFLSPGVSEALRRRALRKLFTSAVFNVPDGLDDYDDDFTSFQALGDVVTSDMRHQAEMEAERAKQARADAEPASGDEDESGGAGDERPATAGDDATDFAEAGPAAGTEPSEPRLSGEADSMGPTATGDAAEKEVRAKQARSDIERSDFESPSGLDGEPIDAEQEWRT